MALEAVVTNADRMMTRARALSGGVEVTFADGRSGVVPYGHTRGIEEEELSGVELPSPYEMVLSTAKGESVEIPWDFARGYCDPSYRSRAEATASRGRQTLGRRIRRLRREIGMTQERLAEAAGIGRVTLVRIENGEQSPRFETLSALADALGRPATSLLMDDGE